MCLIFRRNSSRNGIVRRLNRWQFLSAFNPEYLLGQNLTPAAPGDGTTAPGLGPDQDSPGTGRIAFLRRLYEMYDAGALKGSLLGQQPPEQFADQPVAPPPPTG